MGKKSIFLSILLVVVLVGIGVGGYMLWPAINGAINKSKYYTSEQVQEAYDKGYDDGINNETELNAQIEYYKNLTDEYYVQIVDYQKQVKEFKQSAVALQNSIDSLNSLKAENEKTIQDLQGINAEQLETINTLNSTISSLTDQVSSLEQQKTTNLAKIDELNLRIGELTTQIANLESVGEDKDSQITLLKGQKTELEGQVANLKATVTNLNGQIDSLNSQVRNLQSNVEQLESTNALNLKTINSLNAQILALNTQISELTLQIQSNGSTVAGLNKKIEELEKSIEYYEGYIKSLQSGEKVVVTFEFDGSVINVQVVSKGSKVSIVDPQSTDYVIFNYWTVGGEKISLSDYTVNDSVTIVANVTYKFDVKFMVDSGEHNKQIIEKDHFATTPSNPIKDGYEFDGWTVNGVDIVDVSSYKITGTTTFIAKFTKLHTVTFMYENETKSTQKVRNGEFASNVSVDSTDYKVFNGWTVNGGKVDVSSYKITADITFIADVTYKYDVKFMVDAAEHNKQIVEKDHFATVPSNPSKAGYEFDGWTINGNDIVDVSSYKITGATTFVAKFTQLHTVTFMDSGDVSTTQSVRHGENIAKYYVDSNSKDKEFWGWALDGVNIIDEASYSIESDVTLYSVFRSVLTGSWKGTSEKGDGNLFGDQQYKTVSFDFYIFESGVVKGNYDNSEFVSQLSFNVDTDTYTISLGGVLADCFSLKFVDGYWYCNKISGFMIAGGGDFVYKLEHTDILPEHSYLAPFQRSVRYSSQVGDEIQEKTGILTFDGFSYDLSSELYSSGSYVVLGDIFCQTSSMGGAFNTFELTDSYFKYGDAYYYFE